MTVLLGATAFLFVCALLALSLVAAMRRADREKLKRRLGGGTVAPQVEAYRCGRVRVETTPILFVAQTSWLFPRRRA